MATPLTLETVLVASSTNANVGYIRDHISSSDLDAKPAPSSPSSLSLPSTPSSGSSGSKRPWGMDEEGDEYGSDWDSEPKRARMGLRLGSLSPISSGRSSLGSLDDVQPHLPQSGDDFLDFRSRPGTVSIDKTQCVIDLPANFQYLLLRPPRFGKTTFLSTMYHYYDIRGAEQFARRFEATKASTSALPHSQHLCMYFDLKSIRVDSDHKRVASHLRTHALSVLSEFLVKYAGELELSHPRTFLSNEADIGNMFVKVFDCVQRHGFTLFVGVDNYDAPTRPRSFSAAKFFASHEILQSSRDTELLLDSRFWVPLLAGSHLIAKLVVTGTFLVKYPALKNLAVSSMLQAACGFSEQEAIEFSRSVLDTTQDIVDLRSLCGAYTFPSQANEGGMVEPVLHPQLLLNRLGALPSADADPFKLVSDLLDLLPLEAGLPGAVTVNDLVELLAAGAVEFVGQMYSPFDFDATKAINWSTLYYAGALSRDIGLPSTLRVANSAALRVIHSCVDTFFADRHDLLRILPDAWYQYNLLGDPQSFLDLISRIFRDQTRRSFNRKHAPDLRGILELVLRNSTCLASPKMTGPLILLPADVIRAEIPASRPDKMLVWELKTVSLRGMWLATNLNDDEPTAEALETLHAELVQLDEKALLARPYRVWSSKLNAMETVLVGSFLDADPAVPQLLAVGGAQVLMREPPCQPEEDDEDDEADYEYDTSDDEDEDLW
ncbi:hypothetical protein C8R47DRAFT_1100441 [Mycena vitilis]|nr:hypothetical protein C8R47DRAFT_1100441 [Mycena vitilis]